MALGEETADTMPAATALCVLEQDTGCLNRRCDSIPSIGEDQGLTLEIALPFRHCSGHHRKPDRRKYQAAILDP
jgi:hypothetical protein